MAKRFEWDSYMNVANREKHGIDLDEARYIFDGMVYTVEGDRSDYGELQQISIGSLNRDQVFNCVFYDDIE